MIKYDVIVIKIGSSTLTNKNGKLDLANLRRIVCEISGIKKKVIVVTSGAIVTGAERMGLKTKPRTIPEKQAAAAVGQSALMRQYEKAFEEHGLITAQLLLTRGEIAEKVRRLNTKNTLVTLLKEGVVPVVNENDTVAVEEIKVGDNDTLSALVAVLIGADLLIMLTDIDGFYMKTGKGADYKVDVIEEITKKVVDAAGHPGTQLGVGGMITKIQAAKICSKAGVPVIIAHGREKGLLKKIINGGKAGTFFKPHGSKT